MELPPDSVALEEMSYTERYLRYTYATGNEEPYFLTFRGLQRLNLVHLQNKLAQKKSVIWKGKEGTEESINDLTSTLHAYANAIRDYEFLSSLQNVTGSYAEEKRRDLTHAFPEIANLPGDPFNSAYCRLPNQSLLPRDPLRDWLKARLPRRLTYTKREQFLRTDEYLNGEAPEEVSHFIDKLARFMVAFSGGLSLVVPMVIMRVQENLTKSLVTVCVAVVLFAAIISLVLRANNTETVMATAAYAAVLVVFVGTSG
ncbi:hypothetical protein CBS147343_10571 [Aspergillus niger]|nr:hypothetical protein CBS11350_5720 [Aspergillus niger]KAI2910205.1 hypothetical protein CBS147371_9109 [Aspergillus niger]KAI2941468.1 hypothetical protein CBS147321_5907 [Aspergillus niger]KAI3056235.1 hypothetical protein CBS147343_10571 [Aspergillus niger]